VKSEELFRKLLGLEDPWVIKEIKFDHQGKRVDIVLFLTVLDNLRKEL
jgi:hypothetical protein